MITFLCLGNAVELVNITIIVIIIIIIIYLLSFRYIFVDVLGNTGFFSSAQPLCCELSRSVGIATGYGLDGRGIKSQWGRDFPHLSRPALRSIQPPVQWVSGLFRG